MMHPQLQKAITLRQQGQYENSRQLLQQLIAETESVALQSQAHLHMAWAYDNQGLESQALPHYRSALDGELSNTDRRETLLGLGSTLRCLGEYQNALAVFEEAAQHFPDALEFRPFHAMCLYNLGRYNEAVALLLKALLASSDKQEIQAYRHAIELYAQNLDACWKTAQE